MEHGNKDWRPTKLVGAPRDCAPAQLAGQGMRNHIHAWYAGEWRASGGTLSRAPAVAGWRDGVAGPRTLALERTPRLEWPEAGRCRWDHGLVPGARRVVLLRLGGAACCSWGLGLAPPRCYSSSNRRWVWGGWLWLILPSPPPYQSSGKTTRWRRSASLALAVARLLCWARRLFPPSPPRCVGKPLAGARLRR